SAEFVVCLALSSSPVWERVALTISHGSTLLYQLTGLYILIYMRPATERSTLRHTQQSRVVSRRQLSLISEPSSVSPDRSYLKNPGLLARFLTAFQAPSLLPPSRFGAMSTSADSSLRQEADPTFAYETLDLVPSNSRLDSVILFWVDPDPIQSPAQKACSQSLLVLQTHSELSSVLSRSSSSAISAFSSVFSSPVSAGNGFSSIEGVSVSARPSSFPGFAM